MGKLRIIQSSPLATIQDLGRFEFRKYGIPQSGVIDPEGMQIANQLAGNDIDSPLIEYALGGLKLEALETTSLGVFGASLKVNGQDLRVNGAMLKSGDIIELSTPRLVYAYVAPGGQLQLEKTFDSFSTYLPGRFGGIDGRSLINGDVLKTNGNGVIQKATSRLIPGKVIRFMKGPEWDALSKPFHSKEFSVDQASNRIGIRLIGEKLVSTISDIKSSAVIPGTIQLPPSGQPIVLMNDCQTTGGYPRIGKVLDEDLGKLGQIRPNKTVLLKLVS